MANKINVRFEKVAKQWEEAVKTNAPVATKEKIKRKYLKVACIKIQMKGRKVTDIEGVKKHWVKGDVESGYDYYLVNASSEEQVKNILSPYISFESDGVNHLGEPTGRLMTGSAEVKKVGENLYLVSKRYWYDI